MAIVNELPKTLSVLTTLTVYQMKNDKSYILNSKNDKRYDNMIFPSCQENNNFGVKRLQCSKVYWYKLIKLVKRQNHSQLYFGKHGERLRFYPISGHQMDHFQFTKKFSKNHNFFTKHVYDRKQNIKWHLLGCCCHCYLSPSFQITIRHFVNYCI